MGGAAPKDGVVNLALGLGKTIVDGGVSWSYSAEICQDWTALWINKRAPEKQSKRKNVGVESGTPGLRSNPETRIPGTVKSIHCGKRRNSEEYLCSTYDPQSDRLQRLAWEMPDPGVNVFSPLLELKDIPLNEMIKSLLSICQEKLDSPVEIEFAMTFDPPELGLVQVRSMVVSSDVIDVTDEDLHRPEYYHGFR